MPTICGHFDFSTKKFTFDNAACDNSNYCAEYIRSGIHAGQIEVTVNEVNCDDTYYGCLNRTTGRFSVTIPDNCCEITTCAGLPDTISLDIVGTNINTDCGACSLIQEQRFEGSNFNGLYYILTKTGSYWEGDFSFNYKNYFGDIGSGCNTLQGEYDQFRLHLTCDEETNNIGIDFYIHRVGGSWVYFADFYGNGTDYYNILFTPATKQLCVPFYGGYASLNV